MQGGACKKVTWGQGTLGGKRLSAATMGATGRDSKITKRRHGHVPSRYTCLYNYVDGQMVVRCLYAIHKETSTTIKSWHFDKNAYL